MPTGVYERKKRPAVERFWGNVDKGGDCWEWTAGKISDGYGHFWFEGKQWRAHRLSWFLHNGEIPEGMFICHRCDNPGCVNPSHLFLGTQKDNLQDASRKGRMVNGEAINTSVLTEEKVLAIREEYKTGNITQRALAKKYNTSQGNIWHIVNRKTWTHI